MGRSPGSRITDTYHLIVQTNVQDVLNGLKSLDSTIRSTASGGGAGGVGGGALGEAEGEAWMGKATKMLNIAKGLAGTLGIPTSALGAFKEWLDVREQILDIRRGIYEATIAAEHGNLSMVNFIRLNKEALLGFSEVTKELQFKWYIPAKDIEDMIGRISLTGIGQVARKERETPTELTQRTIKSMDERAVALKTAFQLEALGFSPDQVQSAYHSMSVNLRMDMDQIRDSFERFITTSKNSKIVWDDQIRIMVDVLAKYSQWGVTLDNVTGMLGKVNEMMQKGEALAPPEAWTRTMGGIAGIKEGMSPTDMILAWSLLSSGGPASVEQAIYGIGGAAGVDTVNRRRITNAFNERLGVRGFNIKNAQGEIATVEDVINNNLGESDDMPEGMRVIGQVMQGFNPGMTFGTIMQNLFGGQKGSNADAIQMLIAGTSGPLGGIAQGLNMLPMLKMEPGFLEKEMASMTAALHKGPTEENEQRRHETQQTFWDGVSHVAKAIAGDTAGIRRFTDTAIRGLAAGIAPFDKGNASLWAIPQTAEEFAASKAQRDAILLSRAASVSQSPSALQAALESGTPLKLEPGTRKSNPTLDAFGLSIFGNLFGSSTENEDILKLTGNGDLSAGLNTFLGDMQKMTKHGLYPDKIRDAILGNKRVPTSWQQAGFGFGQLGIHASAYTSMADNIRAAKNDPNSALHKDIEAWGNPEQEKAIYEAADQWMKYVESFDPNWQSDIVPPTQSGRQGKPEPRTNTPFFNKPSMKLSEFNAKMQELDNKLDQRPELVATMGWESDYDPLAIGAPVFRDGKVHFAIGMGQLMTWELADLGLTEEQARNPLTALEAIITWWDRNVANKVGDEAQQKRYYGGGDPQGLKERLKGKWVGKLGHETWREGIIDRTKALSNPVIMKQTIGTINKAVEKTIDLNEVGDEAQQTHFFGAGDLKGLTGRLEGEWVGKPGHETGRSGIPERTKALSNPVIMKQTIGTINKAVEKVIDLNQGYLPFGGSWSGDMDTTGGPSNMQRSDVVSNQPTEINLYLDGANKLTWRDNQRQAVLRELKENRA